jgi:hypothetical protein
MLEGIIAHLGKIVPSEINHVAESGSKIKMKK